MNRQSSVSVLGLHPSSRGFGWVLLEESDSPFDWGTVDIRGDKNAGAVARVEELFRKYQPDILAIEAFDNATSCRSERIRALCRAIVRLTEKQALPVHIFSRQQIRETFKSERARTREEIASAIADRIAPLRSRLPAKRKIWIGEHPNIALFCAAACALTYSATERI